MCHNDKPVRCIIVVVVVVMQSLSTFMLLLELSFHKKIEQNYISSGRPTHFAVTI